MNSRLLEMLKKTSEDNRSLTVGQLIDQLQQEVDAKKKEEEEANKAICNKFIGKCIKFSDPDGLFGDEMTYIRIDAIKIGSLTTDWERLFELEGTRVFFSSGFTGEREINSKRAGESMTAIDLEKATIIDEEEFEAAKNQCYLVNSMIDKMRK